MNKTKQIGHILVLLGVTLSVLPAHSQTEQESKAGPKVCFNPNTLSSVCPPVGKTKAFDFTALDSSGAVTKTLGSHHCVRDNVTQLIWSTQNIMGKNWKEATSAGADYTRCGFSTGWSLPTYRELTSIVQYGKTWPSIDTNYFPNTAIDWYWVSDEAQPANLLAVIVSFKDGGSNIQTKNSYGNVYLVQRRQ